MKRAISPRGSFAFTFLKKHLCANCHNTTPTTHWDSIQVQTAAPYTTPRMLPGIKSIHHSLDPSLETKPWYVQIAIAHAGGVGLCLEVLQPPSVQRAASLELLAELQTGILAPPVFLAFAVVRVPPGFRALALLYYPYNLGYTLCLNCCNWWARGKRGM